jgi:hypothetical protein
MVTDGRWMIALALIFVAVTAAPTVLLAANVACFAGGILTGCALGRMRKK